MANDKIIEQEGDACSGGAKGNLAHNSLENPATANEGSPHTEVTLRVLIEASNSAEREFWVTRMQAYGVKIQQSGQTGIDVKGTPDALSEALDVSVKVVDGETRLTGQPKKSSHENSDPPNAYVPRKPEMF